KDRFVKLDALQLAADIAFARKRFGEAERFYRDVLEFPNVDPPPAWRAKAGIAAVRDALNMPDEAEALYNEAVESMEKARTGIRHEEFRLSFLSSGIAVYSDYTDFLIRHGRPEDALRQADLSRARTLAEGLSTKSLAKPLPAPGGTAFQAVQLAPQR